MERTDQPERVAVMVPNGGVVHAIREGAYHGLFLPTICGQSVRPVDAQPRGDVIVTCGSCLRVRRHIGSWQ